MTSRLLAIFALSASMVGLACAQDLPTDKPKPSAEAKVKQALAVADDDLPKAIEILEDALQSAPKDRKALFLLGVMTTVQGEKVADKAKRIALFHKAATAFAGLAKAYPEPTRNETAFNLRALKNEARAYSLEGKTKEALEAIKVAMAAGFADLDELDSEKDFDPLRKLPEFRTMADAAYEVMVAEARKDVAEEFSGTKSFPFDFGLKDVDDKAVTLADYKGKVTIVDVWGTWCPPCRKEIPHFVDLLAKYKDKGLEIVGINCNEQGSRDQVKKTIRDFAKENKVAYRCVLDDETTANKIPGFQGYPTTLFLDGAGKVRLMLVGYTPKARLEAIVTTLLAEGTKSDGAKDTKAAH